MFRNLLFLSFVLLAIPTLIGCGSEGPASVVDGSDTDAIAEYEALIAAEEKAANSGMAETE